MTRTIETVVWCSACRVEKYTVYRVQGSNEGVFQNEVEPRGAFAKTCNVCGKPLERKQ